MKGCVDVLRSLWVDEASNITVYQHYLEPAFLRESEAFYKAEGQKLLESCDAPEFLVRVSPLPSATELFFLVLDRWKIDLRAKIYALITTYIAKLPHPFDKFCKTFF